MIDLITIAQQYFTEMKSISAKEIVVRDEVRKLCEQNSCGYYGTNWTCPPAVAPLKTFESIFSSFDTMLVVYSVHHVKSSFDWKGMMIGAAEFKKRLQTLKKAIKTSGSDIPFLLLGMGACDLCKKCTYTLDQPCIYPDNAIVSMEACGIDVMRLAKDHGLKYYHGKNTVTYFGGILYNDTSLCT